VAQASACVIFVLSGIGFSLWAFSRHCEASFNRGTKKQKRRQEAGVFRKLLLLAALQSWAALLKATG
jgi:hypothetical protein